MRKRHYRAPCGLTTFYSVIPQEAIEDLEARHRGRFRIDQAGLFVSQTTTRQKGKSVQISQYRELEEGDARHFATLFDNGLGDRQPNFVL